MEDREELKIYVNYSAGEVLDAVRRGNASEKMRFLYGRIMDYAHRTYKEVKSWPVMSPWRI